jgi:hypothetical protein
MSPRIKNQHGVVINNVDRDQVIYGGQHVTTVTSEEARRAVCDLREALAGADLDVGMAAQVRAQVAEIDAMVRAPKPDKSRAAAPLKRLVDLLTNAGSLATAGAALVGPLQILASWLGVHGAVILSLLAL